MLYATLDSTTGYLTNFRYDPENREPNDVPIATMPSGDGPFVYDLASGTASTDQKRIRIAAVDTKTATLLASGFVYNGHSYALDPASVTNWMGMTIAASALPYPFTIADLSGTLTQLTSASDVQAFFAAGVARSAAIQQGGIALKAQLAAAPDATTLDSIQDART